jgi:hypothetical protein
VEILFIMVANEFQADSVLYGNAGAVRGNLYELAPSVLTFHSECIYQVGLLFDELKLHYCECPCFQCCQLERLSSYLLQFLLDL